MSVFWDKSAYCRGMGVRKRKGGGGVSKVRYLMCNVRLRVGSVNVLSIILPATAMFHYEICLTDWD